MRFLIQKVIHDVANHRQLSLCHIDISKKVVAIMAKAKAVGVEITLPVDSITWCFGTGTQPTTSITDCNDDPLPCSMEMDYGPVTRLTNKHAIQAAKTIIWSGPIGQYIMKASDSGTRIMMEQVVEATTNGLATTVVLGRDTMALFKTYGCLDKVSQFSEWSSPSWSMFIEKRLMGMDTLSGNTSPLIRGVWAWAGRAPFLCEHPFVVGVQKKSSLWEFILFHADVVSKKRGRPRTTPFGPKMKIGRPRK